MAALAKVGEAAPLEATATGGVVLLANLDCVRCAGHWLLHLRASAVTVSGQSSAACVSSRQ